MRGVQFVSEHEVLPFKAAAGWVQDFKKKQNQTDTHGKMYSQ
jgi:hypothetical protein